MSDLIERQDAIDAVKTYWKQQVDALDKHSGFETVTDACDAILKHNVGILNAIEQLPSAEPEKRTEKHTETHACDCISRQAAIDAIADYLSKTTYTSAISFLNTGALILARVPSAEPEPVGCSGCRYERFGNRVCDVCSRFYVDRYEAERRTNETD